MNKIFKYSLLKYRPSSVLDEQVNIGILFIFVDDSKVQFTFPKSLARLSALYPDIDLHDTKRYLSAFQSRATKLSNKNLFVEVNTGTLIEKEFLLADANSFFFSDFKVGIYESVEKTVTHFTNQYFAYYNDPSVFAHKDDKYLVRKFAHYLKETEKNKLFRKEVRLKTDNITANFDYCWQNGTTNFIKSVSFDLKHKETIQKKSALCWAEMVQLQLDNQTQNRRFDFLVLPPSDKGLFKPYENALQLLNSLKIQTKIITESDIPNYTHEAIETIKPLELKFA